MGTTYKKCMEYMNDLLESKNSYIDTLLFSCPLTLKFNDLTLSQSYKRAPERYLTTTHNGQVKLFLSEIQFLTNSLKNINDEAYVIYAGSAPGNKNVHLSDLFPNVKFIFIDPEEHFFMMREKNQYDSKEIMDRIMYLSLSQFKTKFEFKKHVKPPYRVNMYNPVTRRVEPVDREHPAFSSKIFSYSSMIMNHDEYNIYVIENFFTSELSKDLAKLKNSGKKLFFISDIRTVDEKSDSPTSGDIIWNSAQMYNWVSILKPDRFMLKFRCPFSYGEDVSKYEKNKDIIEAKERGIDFIENYKNGIYKFIKSEDIFLQAYQGHTSTESRLVGKYPFEIESYDIKDYEDKFYFYNRIIRQLGYNDIPKQFLDKYHMIDRCSDCAIAYHILSSYLKKKNLGLDDPVKTHNLFSSILENLRREVITSSYDAHGMYYNRILDIDTLNEYNSFMCEIKDKEIYRNIFNQPVSSKHEKQYIKNIIKADPKDRINVRNECMIHYLFGQSKVLDFNLDYDISKHEKSDNINYIFSQEYCGNRPIEIEDKGFYNQFHNFYKSHNISNVIVIRSTKYDPFFNKSFYSTYTVQKDVHNLITSFNYIKNNLRKDVNKDTLIIICSEEIPSIFFHLRKYFISKFRNNKILFMRRSPYKIYTKYYIADKHKNIIHLESYDRYNSSKKFSPKALVFDIGEIDRGIGFILKDIPYLFIPDSIQETSQNILDYEKYSRIYMLSQENLDFLTEFDENMYTLTKSNERCNEVFNKYFLFTNKNMILPPNLIQLYIRLNGNKIKKPLLYIKDISDLYGLQLALTYSYVILNIRKKSFDSVKSIVNDVIKT